MNVWMRAFLEGNGSLMGEFCRSLGNEPSLISSGWTKGKIHNLLAIEVKFFIFGLSICDRRARR